MDKYEEAAREYLKVEPPMLTTIDSWYDLALIFRWYDERREKEMCECHVCDAIREPWWEHCPNCGRRIVEKVSVVAPVSQTGSSKKSVIQTPDE